MSRHVSLLIIGAGPYGLAMAAYAKHAGIDHLVVGKPMEFWRSNMPDGMYLRSGCDWHYDPFDVHTIDRYLETMGLTSREVEPLALDFYLGYPKWFQQQKGIEVWPSFVERLDRATNGDHYFTATLEHGDTITAKNVVIAVGFRYFKHVPEDLTGILPAGHFSHTCDFVDLSSVRGKRYLIIGGRQSAFEWAALLNEHGAALVHLSHRHESPEFKESDWSWVPPLVDAIVLNPGWFRNLSAEEQGSLSRRFWAEGRLKLEPWLEPRIRKDTVKLWPKSQVVSCTVLPSGELKVRLDIGEMLAVDRIILATGYRVNLSRIPFLAEGNILAQLETRNGFPTLDERFQSNLPGLFFTSLVAAQDFGPFFGFTVAVRQAARIIGPAIRV